MIKNFIKIMCKKIWFLTCIPFLIVFGLITLPLTLFFKWKWFWILVVAHHENCSLSKAKKLFLENKDRKYTIVYGSTLYSNISNNSVATNFSSAYNSDIVSNAAYSSLSCNIHHRD